jgi:succinate dehydrogenase/fumarate reductase-like Fe-S protein
MRAAARFRDYTTGVSEGMVVLDAVNHIQATQANDLAVDGTAKRASAARVRRK